MCKFKLLFMLLATMAITINSATAQSVSQHPKFGAISDIHVGREGWEAKATITLNKLLSESPKLDAIFIAGDMTHGGRLEEFTTLKNWMDQKVPANIDVYYCMGNHDWWTSAVDCGNRFENILGQSLNQFVDIKGYPFILISMETEKQTHVYLEKTRAFLEEKLAYASENYPEKPIFLFQHVPNEGTVYGSYEIAGDDNWGTSSIIDICNKYPQIITFSGHSHFLLTDERSIHQDKFTSVNDGSIAYAEVEEGLVGGYRPEGNENIIEGCIVSVDENNDVEIKRWNFFNDIELKQPWVIKAPHNGTMFTYKNRTGGESPSFKSSDKISISSQTKTSCRITFPVAKDDDLVHQYRVEVMDGEMRNLVQPAYKILSRFYLQDNESIDSMDLDIADLKPNIEYIIRVIAVDSFGNESNPLVSKKFKSF